MPIAAMDRDPSSLEALSAIAELQAGAFASHSVYDFADTIIQHIRTALAPVGQDPPWLQGMRHTLGDGVRKACLENNPEPLIQTLQHAATQLDREPRAVVDGTPLRLCLEPLVEAATGIAGRTAGLDEAAAARRMESAGSPPSMLLRLDGTLVWFNGALVATCEKREISRADLLADAGPLVRQVAASSRALGGNTYSGQPLSKRGKTTRVLLQVSLRAGDEDPRVTLVEVQVSMARRETKLTARELEVATLLAEHYSYQQVATATRLALDSVRTYVRRIYGKLAVNNRALLRARLIHDGLYVDASRRRRLRQ